MTKNISKTLIIGLGGTGQRVICDIKKRLLRTYGEIPNLVKFLSLDTDTINKKDNAPFEYYYGGKTHKDFKYLIEPREFFQIPYSGVDVVIRDPVCSEKLDLDLLREVSARLRDKVAGSYRILGRAHFLNSSLDIINLLQQAICDLRYACLGTQEIAKGYVIGGASISVYVIASLAGDTGSSAIMDISRMLQIAGLNVQYATEAASDKIFGVFFLPEFFAGLPNTDNIYINAYTALSELDHTFDLANPYDPTGSRARKLQDDKQSYQGYPGSDKRVIYDSIFLIDSHTKHHRIHKLKEASKYVASFIASSIAADSQAIISSYVNSDHKRYEVEGKYQNYSGMGYCEIRFCRQELVNYLLNKKLLSLLEQYKAGDPMVETSHIAQSFINVNRLNEGVRRGAQGNDTRPQLNELTDAIIDMNDRRFAAIPMPIVETGREAADAIETSKARYLSNIRVAAQQAIQAFASRRIEILESLKTLLDHHMTQKGFGMFPDLAHVVKTLFVEMKEGLEDELRRNDDIFNRIDRHELYQLRLVIGENSSRGFLGIGSKRSEQEAYIHYYCNTVRFEEGSMTNPTLAWLVVDSARKREAVAIYEEIIGIVDSYYKEERTETVNGPEIRPKGGYMSVDGLYKVLMDTLLRAISSYQPSMAAVNETVFADAYFKDYFEHHWDETVGLTPQASNELNEYIGELFAQRPTIDEAKLEEMRQKLLGLLPVDGLVRKIQAEEMSIDELFIHCFGDYRDILDPGDTEGNPQLKMLMQVDDLFDTLWSYLNFNGQGLQPVKNMVVGVYDTGDYIFDTNHGYEATISGWNRYDYISLGDPDRIAFMLMETAIPAFKLEGMDAWANEFKQRRSRIYTFSDKRLEGIDMIMPGVYDEATNGRHE